jgi:carbon-monoxide dehydrogenase small subunit
MANNRHVTTLEGLHDDVAKTVKRAFLESHALQCGYCTSGFLITIYSLIKNRTRLDHDSVRSAIVGNLCRCTGYRRIVEAALKAGQYVPT